tara:strand:- start:286 stop:840 length:555 start_codon:yes stop_codon:yes gene_type:complete
MNTIFTIDDTVEQIDKINLDELFEKKQIHDLATTKNYNTILNRIHSKIKLTSRQQIIEQYCWFLVPEVMIGVPKYDQATCIAYVIDKLQTNGFKVRYTHPNLLLISWQHWVPAYVRAEIKKKTGISIDGFGNIKNEEKEEIQELTMKNNKPTHIIKNNNDKRPIKEYKPTGKLIYNSNLLNTLK